MAIFWGFACSSTPPQTADKQSSDHLSICLPDVQSDIVDRTSTSGKEKRDGVGALLLALW